MWHGRHHALPVLLVGAFPMAHLVLDPDKKDDYSDIVVYAHLTSASSEGLCRHRQSGRRRPTQRGPYGTTVQIHTSNRDCPFFLQSLLTSWGGKLDSVWTKRNYGPAAM